MKPLLFPEGLICCPWTGQGTALSISVMFVAKLLFGMKRIDEFDGSVVLMRLCYLIGSFL